MRQVYHVFQNQKACRASSKREDVPLLLMKAIREENIIGYQGKGYGRPIYSVEFQGKIVQVAISVGTNGFIVGANLNSKGK